MTMYSLSHFIQLGLLPPGINILFIILGMCVWFFHRITGSIILMTGIVSLWVLSTPIVAYHYVNLLQNQYPLLNDEMLTADNNHDAILVLGGGDMTEVEYHNARTVSDFTLHRLKYAAYLHDKTHLPIIVSGGKTIASLDSEADLMAKILQDNYDIPVTIKESNSMTTADESRYILSILKQHDINRVYLVTNAWHMPRSVYIFECAGVNVTPAPMGYFSYGPGYALISYLPNIDALYASSIAMHEYIGMLWYRLYYSKQCVNLAFKK